MKKPLKIALFALLALVLAALAYVIYVFAAYYRGESGADGGAERRCHRGGGEGVRHPLL